MRRASIEGAMVALPIGAIVLLILGIPHKRQEAASCRPDAAASAAFTFASSASSARA